MDGFVYFDTENYDAGANKPKGGKMAKGSLMVSASRKRLADISNLQQQRFKPAIQQVKQQFESHTNKEYVDNLQKENKTLMKLLADRNKIIELSRVELQNLRINLHKVQQQNFQLAQANSQLLGELNLGKDRLKELQHELGCKNGLLIARKLEAEERAKRVSCQNAQIEVRSTKCVEAGEFLHADKENGPCKTKRERQFNNLPLCTPAVEVVQDKEKADNKRRLRRQSAKFKPDERESTEELFETNDVKFPLCDNVDHQSGPTCSLLEKTDPTTGAVQAKKADNKRRFTRQSARCKTEEQEATDHLLETKSNKFPVSPLCDNVDHESGPTCSLLEKTNPTTEAVQAKEKADNKRRFTRQSARCKTEEQEATEHLLETDSNKFHVSLCDNVIHESDPICLLLEKEDPSAEVVQAKENFENNRRLTRQSARLKTEEREATEVLEINSEKCPVSPLCEDVVHEIGWACPSVKKEDQGFSAPRSEGQDSRRSSSSTRPLRQAAQKITSYKERNLQVKLRRDF